MINFLRIVIIFMLINTIISNRETMCKCPSKETAPEVNITMGIFMRCGLELQKLSPTQQCDSDLIYHCDDFNIPGGGMVRCEKGKEHCAKDPVRLEDCARTNKPKVCYIAKHQIRTCVVNR